MKEKIKEMINLQNKLNNETNGEDWVTTGLTKEKRKINWFRCIYMEAAEAMDSLNWKHWKNLNAEEDFKNVEIELVDIWHFILSQKIVDEGVYSAIDILNKKYNEFESNKDISLLDSLDNILKNAANKEIDIKEFYRAVDLLENFDMEKVYSLYIGKNCLNSFRQDHGYKDKTYIKIWNGKEDNVYMQKIIESEKDITFDELYTKLEEIYKTL